jgi:hypothetical protein
MENKEQGITPEFQQAENVSYSEEVKDSHIDMNPPQVVEPLTGSSVIVEPKLEGTVPDNGFPIGYGPNEHIKKIEKPKKPSFGERLKHMRQKMTKKQKILLAVIPSASILLIGGFIAYASITGMFKTDYSGTYLAAKELKNEMQKLRSDANCDRVVEYVSNEYTTNESYNDYINGCREIAEGVSDSVITKLGDTAGVLKDEEVRRRYETLKNALATAKNENGDVNSILKKYSIWHEWIKAEANGDKLYGDGWPDVDMKNASAILIDSDVDEFKEYGEEWYKYKKEFADATNLYYHHDSSILLTDIKVLMDEKNAAFKTFKKEKEPDVTEVFPLELVDTAKLYAKFEEFYNYVKDTYEKNYNPVTGGCKETVTAVICE